MKLWIYLESWSSLKKYIEPLKIILSIILFALSYVFPKYKLIFLVLSYIIVSYELYINAIKEILSKNKKYDAYFIFDADNILDKNYINDYCNYWSLCY